LTLEKDWFQCRERLGWDFYTTIAIFCLVLSLTAGFQCRERLGWDFYPNKLWWTHQSTFGTFQCRERLGWDFYPTEVPTTVTPTKFQCRERLGWDFYSSR
jgi:hypothetical protein